MSKRNRPVINFLKEYKVVRRLVLVGGATVGVYFLGVAVGWWPSIF